MGLIPNKIPPRGTVLRSSADGTRALGECFCGGFVYVSFRFKVKTFNILTASHHLNPIQTHLSGVFFFGFCLSLTFLVLF